MNAGTTSRRAYATVGLGAAYAAERAGECDR